MNTPEPEQMIEAFRALVKNQAFGLFIAHIRSAYEAADAVHCDLAKTAAENREGLLSKVALKDLPEWPAQELARLTARLQNTPHGGK